MTKFPSNIYNEDFENGLSNWEFGARVGNNRWGLLPGKYSSEYAASGVYALFGNDVDSSTSYRASDSYAAMKNDIYVPPGRLLYFISITLLVLFGQVHILAPPIRWTEV
jgi:hypothetical protein